MNDPAMGTAANQALLERARQLAQAGMNADAVALWNRVVQAEPHNVEAATNLARIALTSGRAQQAVALLEPASRAAPENLQLLKNLGVALGAAGRRDEAVIVLQRAIALAPEFFLAWLHLGQLREDGGDPHGALIAYFRAVTRAQVQGQWLDDATLPPWLREPVLHAMDFVQRERRQLFFGLLQPLREQYGRDAVQRVERCISSYLKELPVAPADPRQLPRFLYFPDLPSQPYYDRRLIPWTERLQDAYPAIRAEAEAVLTSAGSLQPFLEFAPGDHVERYLRGADQAPAWDAFFFYRHGIANVGNQTRCPQTHALLESLPLVRIRGHAPEICFSVLTAGTHILPHTGVSNVRLVVHLPLIVPPDCAIKVGGEVHAWQEGHAVVFDDTFEHEAWNRSDRTRTILLMDAWNPHLTEVERLAVGGFIETIGDLDRGWD